jgi:hypothetical protein
MSSDEVKAAFPQLRLDLVRRAKLADLARACKFGEATMLKEQLDGPLPRGQIVSLRSAKRKLRAVPARDAGIHT